MIYTLLGVGLQEADKAWRASALRPFVQVYATHAQPVSHLSLAGLAGWFRYSIQVAYSNNLYQAGWLGSAIDLEHIQNGTTLVQADKHDLVFVPIQILKEMCIGSSGRGSKLRRTPFGTIQSGLNLIHAIKK